VIDLHDKRVLVMGLGLHGGGLGVTRWLVKQGAHVTITDLKNAEELKPTLEALSDLPVGYVLGEHRESDFTNADLVIRNPGVPRESKFLALAQEQGIPIRMEMGLFFERLPRGAEQVIGITGTKGKTTTTLMVGEILKRENPKTVVAGNLRVSALELLDTIDAETPVVLELSSFQLEEFETLKISPHLAAITNIYPDHLDRYRDMDEYVAAKAQIFLHQGLSDYCILNFDNSIVTHLRPRVVSQVVWFSAKRALNDGALVERGAIAWNQRGTKQRVLRVAELGAMGEHNIENALAATAISLTWGARVELVADALRNFKGAPHRLEVVRELNGVSYINDTTATAPAATVAALKALTSYGGQIYLIAGGSDKRLDFTEMAQMISAQRVKVILLEGAGTEKLEQALKQVGADNLILRKYGQLEDAVLRAREEAKSGDTVLLSPGCASFGMFANEFERGDKFREIVKGLR
jgi:UDP-N-acetylmuramoylalanine--D-glutamate ligase